MSAKRRHVHSASPHIPGEGDLIPRRGRLGTISGSIFTVLKSNCRPSRLLSQLRVYHVVPELYKEESGLVAYIAPP